MAQFAFGVDSLAVFWFNIGMSRSTLLRTIAPSVVLTLLGFLLAYQFVDPAPPRHLTLGTGGPEGAYYLFGERYREILRRNGVELRVLPTAGSVENLALLTRDRQPIDAAFVQGGSRPGGGAPGLLSLGSLYYEPLWVFYRGLRPLRRIPALRGLRLAIGAKGSGTQQLVRRVLSVNGLHEGNSRLLPLGGEAAAAKLLAGELDGVFLVASAQAPLVRRLLLAPGIHLMSFERASAYTRKLRFLSALVLPEGAIDLKRDVPSQDTRLLAASANLVVREDLHPALIDLLLQAAQEIHSGGGWFEKPGEFPNPEHADFPISSDARRFYRYGPPLLQSFLPFWAASLVDRTKVLLLPLVALLIPLLKIMPPIYRWRMRSRVYRWYRELQAIDLGLFHQANPPREQYREELDRIEQEVAKVDIPLSFADELFNLRLHIELIRRRLEGREGPVATPEGPAQRPG